jgi:predicted Zn-dependent protease with MMP-like domain
MSRQIKPEMKPPSLGEIEALAHQALATIPGELARHIRGVVIRVEDFPDEATQREMGLDDDFELLGLYRGTPLPGKSVMNPYPAIDMIHLYRRPILDFWCETGQPLDAVVRHVLIHEIGHHFGFSDEDMERLERQA